MKLVSVKKMIALFSAVSIAMMLNMNALAIEDIENTNQELQPMEQQETAPSDLLKEEIMSNFKQMLETKMTNKGKLDKEMIDLNYQFDAFPEDVTIDLTLRDIDVPSILRILAKEGGMNIVIDESVMGFISAELKNISLNEAMQVILTSEELEARVSNNTLFIASRPVMAKKGLNRRYIKTFKLNHSNSVEISDILEASIFNKGYKVKEDASGGADAANFQAVAGVPGVEDVEDEITGSSTGQSNLIDSKTINGRVETIEPGEHFGDSSRLASTIKVQHSVTKSQPIIVENNDGGAIVIPDTRTNSILVAGLKEDILLAEEAIKYLDQPLKQVSIEVSLIELTKEDTEDLGLKVTSQGGKMGGGFNSVVGEFSGYEFISSSTNQSGIVLNTVSSLADEVAFRLETLLQNKKGKLLANPKIIALNNSESLIKITDQVISSVETTITDTATTYTAELADVGIVLNILPKIGDDGYVTMRIRPSITTALDEVTIGEFADDGAAIRITPISTRELIIQDVRVKSGETLSIAGLNKQDETETVGKVPLLCDIPVFGALFKNKTSVKVDTELVILITPKIIDDVAYGTL